MKTGLMSYTQTRMSTGRTGDIQGEASGLLSFYYLQFKEYLRTYNAFPTNTQRIFYVSCQTIILYKIVHFLSFSKEFSYHANHTAQAQHTFFSFLFNSFFSW